MYFFTFHLLDCMQSADAPANYQLKSDLALAS